jgi:hypothetical protein
MRDASTGEEELGVKLFLAEILTEDHNRGLFCLDSGTF